MIVNNHASVGNWTRVLCKKRKCSKPLSSKNSSKNTRFLVWGFCLFLNVKKYFHIFCWKQQLFDISITGTLKYRRSVFRCYSNANIAILRAHSGNRDGGGKKMKERWKHGSVSVPHHPAFQEWPLLPCSQRLQESQGTKTATSFLFLPPDRGPGSTKPWHHHHDILLSDLIVRVLPVLSQRGYTERHAVFASEI